MKASTISKTVLGMAVLAELVAGPVAEASNPTVVTGTTEGDQIQGMNGPQIIYGRGGDDRINGGKGPDIVYGGRGDDVLKDFASGQSPGLLVGGPGRDRCIGDKLDTFRGCEVVKIRPHWE